MQVVFVAVQRSSEFAPVPAALDTTSCPIGPERASEALKCRWTSSNVVVHGALFVQSVPAMLPSFCTTRTPIGTEAPDATGMSAPVFHIPSAESRVIGYALPPARASTVTLFDATFGAMSTRAFSWTLQSSPCTEK